MGSIKILRDQPIGEKGKDWFQHQLYSDLLKDIVQTDHKGICIGLLGRWGLGKSTVIQLLQKSLDKNVTVVVFNAYHARGDSFRRQFLLKVLQSIESPSINEFEHKSGLQAGLENASDEIKQEFKGYNFIRKTIFKTLKDPISIFLTIVAAICSAVAVLALLNWIISIFRGDDGKAIALLSERVMAWAWIGFSTCVAYVFLTLKNNRQQMLEVFEPIPNDKSFKLPEQFAKVFVTEVKIFNSKSKKLVIVVDDLDRCDEATVIEALACVRQFCHGEHQDILDCKFIIPCAEDRLKEIFTQVHGAADVDEGLRKFFDVVMRMDEIVPESLVEFAAAQASEAGMDAANAAIVAKIVDAAAIRDPRKVKSFINALTLEWEILRRRQTVDSFPSDVHLPYLASTLSVLVALKEFDPAEYQTISKNPDTLNNFTINGITSIAPPAHRVIEFLKPLSGRTAEALITKQYEKNLFKIPNGLVFASAVQNEDSARALEILIGSNEDSQKKLLSWLERKSNKAYTTVRLRYYVAIAADYAESTKWNEIALHFFSSLVDLGSRLEVLIKEAGDDPHWRDIVPKLPKYEHDRYISAYFIALEAQGWENSDFLKIVILSENRLTVTEVKKLKNGLRSFLKIKQDSLNTGRIGGFGLFLKKNPKALFGFFPELGFELIEAQFSGRTDISQIRPDYWSPFAIASSRFLGIDTQYTAESLKIWSNRVQTGNPHAVLSLENSEFHQHHGFLMWLNNVANSQSTIPNFENVYWPRIKLYLDQRQGEKGVHFAVEKLICCYRIMGDRGQSDLANLVVNLIDPEEDLISSIPHYLGERPSDAVDKWDKFSEYLWDGLDHLLQQQSILTPQIKLFYENAHKTAWLTTARAERSLAEKVRRLNPKFQPTTANIESWKNSLFPFCKSDSRTLELGIEDGLKNNNSNPALVIDFACKTMWRNGVPKSSLPVIAKVLLDSAETCLLDENARKHYESLPNYKEIIRLVIKLAPNQPSDWKERNNNAEKILHYLSEYSLKSKFEKEFQEALWLYMQEARYILIAIRVLSLHQKISNDIRSIFQEWLKQNESHPEKSQVKRIISLPSLD